MVYSKFIESVRAGKRYDHMRKLILKEGHFQDLLTGSFFFVLLLVFFVFSLSLYS